MISVMIVAPTPSPAPQVDPQLGSPGFIGFLWIFLVAVALILLVMSMGRHLRKVQRNERLRAAAEEAAAGADETVTDEAIADDDHRTPGGAAESQ